MAALPADAEAAILKRLRGNSGDAGGEAPPADATDKAPADAGAAAPADTGEPDTAPGPGDPGYAGPERKAIDQLIQNAAPGQTAPAPAD